jgi:hypothetical protein
MHKSLMACYTRNAIALQSKSAIASKKASIFQKFLSSFFSNFQKMEATTRFGLANDPANFF